MSSPAEKQLALLATPAFARLWKQARAVLERSSGSFGGAAVVLSAPTEDERIAMSGLLGRHRHSTKSLRVRLDQLDRVLRAGPTGKGLVAILEHLGGPLRDRRAEAAREEDSARRVLQEARAVSRAQEPWFSAWLEGLVSDGTLTKLVRDGRLDLIPTAARILDRLPADGVLLPVFASSMTSDTKALDSGTLSTVVLRGLALRADLPRPLQAADRRALWDVFGVVADDLASQVLVLNMPARPTSALGEWLLAAGRDGVPFRITLHQLSTYMPQFQPARVWVCENPAVLRAAAARFEHRCGPMVCGEGRPSTAFRRLVNMLSDAGCELVYHGDFDWPGIRIANAFLAQHGGSAWRMGASDYVAALQRAKSDELTALTGRPETASWDPALEPAMRAGNRVVFEEMVLDTLLADLARDAATGRTAPFAEVTA